MRRVLRLLGLGLVLVGQPVTARADRLKELVDVDGFRSNHLIGMGLVVGLNGTGDDIISSAVSREEMVQLAKHLGIIVNAKDVMAKNVAAVAVTAELPPFGRHGMKIDVVVSSAGGAKSLQGGTLLVTPIKGADRQTYAIAQGPLMLGAFAVSGGSGSGSFKNHVTVGRIPGGAVLERDAPATMPKNGISLLLRQPDFTTATRIAAAINGSLGNGAAKVSDPGVILVAVSPTWQGRTVELISKLEALDATPDAPARVVIDERTGTVAVGANVRLTAAAIAHGSISINVQEKPAVSQPNAFATGTTTVVPDTQVAVQEQEGQLSPIRAAATVGDVAAALNALGAKPRDLVPIFQALKAAGALHAEIEVM